MKLFLFFILTLFTITANAITIKSIEYKGLVHISESVALRMLDFEVGDSIDDKDLNNALKMYFKQGYFKDAWIDFEEGVLTFHFVEKAIISKISLEGWKESEEDEVKNSIIQIKKGSLFNEKKLEAAKKRIIEALSQEGKIDSVVEIEKEYFDNGSIKVTFVVNEGEEIIIENLEYDGVYGLDSEDFDDVLANKENEFMGWLFGRNDGEMSLTDLEYDNLRIRDFYMQNGYLDAKVEQPFVRVNFDDYTADMSYQIEEGVVYTVNTISIHQVEEVVDDEAIREVISLEEGEVFNIKTFRDNASAIKTLIADMSYAYTQVIPDLRKNKEDNTVDVVFKVIPGEKVRIRDVIISGNTRTLDRIIRRELYLGAGDMYSLTDLKDSRGALGRLGFFDANAIEEKRIDANTMDLVVKVKEAPTGNIQVGGGYGSYGGILVTLGISDQNVWGSGIGVGLQIEKSEVQKTASFNVSNSRLNDSDFSGNFSIHSSDMDYNDYRVISEGITLGTGHRFTRHITGYLSYNYSNNSYEIEDDAAEYLDTRYLESYSKSSITGSLKFDNTDDYYLPREGFTISQSVEKAGLGGDVDFIKSRTGFGAFMGLEDFLGIDTIARYKARYNFLTSVKGYIPLAERFYMGGIGSVRGFESYSISPVVTDDDGDNLRVGGEKTFSNSIELSFPLIPKAKMRLVTFVDYGMISDSTLNEVKSEYLRGGYGVGIEWFSPVGPVQIVFARPIDEEDGDLLSPFEFTMGQRF